MTKLVYSSHNVEWRLKASILENLGGSYSYLIDDIKQTELKAATQADLIISCTTSDENYYKEILPNKSNALYATAGNGVEPFECDEKRVLDWMYYFKNPYPVFVGSAHPPNATGFWAMNKPGLTYLKPYEEVVIIGGVCNIIMTEKGILEYRDLNLSRLHLVGNLGKVELQSMVRASHLVILPIISGEGSNLKTAEALESGRPIVATSKSFRGFEDALSLPHIHIANTPDQFRRLVREILDKPRYENGTPYDIKSQYYWGNTLKQISECIKYLNN